MNDLTGAPVYKVWEEILSVNPSIENINVFSYSPLPNFQERSDTSPQNSLLFEKARELTISKDIPFHDAAIKCALAEGKLNISFINAITKANPSEPVRQLITRDDVAMGALETLARKTQFPHALSITSEVRSQCGVTLHFPMCDLRCPATKKNELQVVQIANHLLPQGGFLINSGNSYHLLGFRTVTHNELMRFFGSCLILVPIIDRMYIAHHLVREYGSLRISKNTKSSHFPFVIRQFK